MLQVNHFARASRGDDTNSLRKDILLLYREEGLRLDPSYSEAPSNLVKHRRGWENDYTARLLCPQELLDTYNGDPEVYVHVEKCVHFINDHLGSASASKLAQSRSRREHTVLSCTTRSSQQHHPAKATSTSAF